MSIYSLSTCGSGPLQCMAVTSLNLLPTFIYCFKVQFDGLKMDPEPDWTRTIPARTVVTFPFDFILERPKNTMVLGLVRTGLGPNNTVVL